MKILKRFYMDKAHPLSFPMVIHSLNVKNNLFCHCEKGKELLGHEVPYLNSIGALIYLPNCTGPNIAYSINLLAMYSFVQPKDIGMVSSIYCATSKEQFI